MTSGTDTAIMLVTILSGLAALILISALLWSANRVSYRWLKERTLRERRWDYNICCGETGDGAFAHVLCSHTLEHVDDPKAMFGELRRVGLRVTILVPPLWDLAAALNPFEHRVIFLTCATRHDDRLPPYVAFRPARWLQSIRAQRIIAHSPGARLMKALGLR